MTDEIDEKILIKIKKLLSLSKKNDSAEESASAAAMAQEMLLRHNISMDMVDGVEVDNRREKVTQEYYKGHRKEGTYNETKWKVLLAFVVAKANLCKTIHSGKSLIWIGTPSNIKISQYLFETIAQDLEQMADTLWSQILRLRQMEEEHGVMLFENPELRTVHGKSWKKSFFLGAIETIRRRLNENLNKLKEEKAINALVVVSDSEISDYMQEKYPKLGTYNSGSTTSYAGYRSGIVAGNDIQFRRGMGSGGTSGPALLKG